MGASKDGRRGEKASLTRGWLVVDFVKEKRSAAVNQK
jgi:hypothetical protein